MCILSCNNLTTNVYDDMYNKELLPINDQLHLLCGGNTTVYLVSSFGSDFGGALNGTYLDLLRMTIPDAWFYAGEQTQTFQTNTPLRRVVFRVAGWPNNFNDDFLSFEDPDSGNPADIIFRDRRVTP